MDRSVSQLCQTSCRTVRSMRASFLWMRVRSNPQIRRRKFAEGRPFHLDQSSSAFMCRTGLEQEQEQEQEREQEQEQRGRVGRKSREEGGLEGVLFRRRETRSLSNRDSIRRLVRDSTRRLQGQSCFGEEAPRRSIVQHPQQHHNRG